MAKGTVTTSMQISKTLNEINNKSARHCPPLGKFFSELR